VSTQSFTNRYLGPAILDALARGLPPDAAIEGALAGDAGRGLRQVHAVDRHGHTAAWTGQNCVEWCGSVAAPGISVAGNMLAGEPTVAATLAAWQANPGLELPERLMLAMEAGETDSETINAVFFRFFKDGVNEFLARSWLIELLGRPIRERLGNMLRKHLGGPRQSRHRRRDRGVGWVDEGLDPQGTRFAGRRAGRHLPSRRQDLGAFQCLPAPERSTWRRANH
jgi:hypothetical protein